MSRRRQIWRASDEDMLPGHFLITRHNVTVGHLYIDPRSVPLGLPAIRQVVIDMMLAASDARVGDALYGALLDEHGDDGR